MNSFHKDFSKSYVSRPPRDPSRNFNASTYPDRDHKKEFGSRSMRKTATLINLNNQSQYNDSQGQGLFQSQHSRYDYKENIQPTFGGDKFDYNYEYNNNCDVYPKRSTKKKHSHYRDEDQRPFRANTSYGDNYGNQYIKQKEKQNNFYNSTVSKWNYQPQNYDDAQQYNWKKRDFQDIQRRYQKSQNKKLNKSQAAKSARMLDNKSSKAIPLYERLKAPEFNQSQLISSSHDEYMSSSTNYKANRQYTSKSLYATQGSGRKWQKNTYDTYQPSSYNQRQQTQKFAIHQPKNEKTGLYTSKSRKQIPTFDMSLIKKESMQQLFREPKLEDFILGDCKGQGRFGKVYLAIHKRTGFLCALKKIKKQSVKYMLDQFIQEIKIQQFLNHPNLVRIYGYFADTEHFYMLIEYMQEGCLYSHLKKNNKKLDQTQTANKMYEICKGIEFMHENNIVHRDMKPQNVVLTNGVCKVCDFGWAAVCQDRRQTYCGTLDYVCPEIVQGNAYDSSVDIWCLGVMAYEMMVGKAPFYDISRQKTIDKIKSCKIESFPSNMSRKAIKFIEMILKKNPEQRVGIQELLNSEFLRTVPK